MSRMEEAQIVSLRINEEERKWLQEYAKAEDLSMSQIMRKALKYYRENLIDKKENK